MHNYHKNIEKVKCFRSNVNHKLSCRFSPSDVKKVLVINSSSRSGSSLLFAMLRRLPGIYSLSGEASPFYKLNNKASLEKQILSDKLSDQDLFEHIDFNGLSQDIFSDLGAANTNENLLTSEIDIGKYAMDITMRLPLQWTDIDFNEAECINVVNRVFEQYRKTNALFEITHFYLRLLKRLRDLYPGINPYYYDIPAPLIRSNFPDVSIPTGPPNTDVIIEEPPYILIEPRNELSSEILNGTLLLKSTVDCYRMNLIEKLFHKAEISIIHLTRNPAATTNGIYDGWLHRGFFSANLKYFMGEKKLNIKGYSDISDYGKYWWNFDLPENWQEYINRNLIDVCAFQWHSANTEILNYICRSGKRNITVRYEEIAASLESRIATFERIIDFTGLEAASIPLLNLDILPVVQSTLPPQLYRWKKRKDIIEGLFNDSKIVQLSEALGYPKSQMEMWV